jgi:hypothetical protein
MWETNWFTKKRLSGMMEQKLLVVEGSVTALAVSCWFPNTVVRVRTHIKSYGICGGRRYTGAGFLRSLLFPLPILNTPIAPHSSSTIRGWYNRPNTGRRTKWAHSDPLPHSKKKKNETTCCSGTPEPFVEPEVPLPCYLYSVLTHCGAVTPRPVSISSHVVR